MPSSKLRHIIYARSRGGPKHSTCCMVLRERNAEHQKAFKTELCAVSTSVMNVLRHSKIKSNARRCINMPLLGCSAHENFSTEYKISTHRANRVRCLSIQHKIFTDSCFSWLVACNPASPSSSRRSSFGSHFVTFPLYGYTAERVAHCTLRLFIRMYNDLFRMNFMRVLFRCLPMSTAVFETIVHFQFT